MRSSEILNIELFRKLKLDYFAHPTFGELVGKFSFLLSKLKVIDGVKTNSYTFFISFRKLTLYQTRFLSKLEEKKMKNIKDPSLTCLKVEEKKLNS